MGLTWTKSPSSLANELRQRAAVVPAAVHEIGQNGAKRWEAKAKEIRPWTDRTSAARGGLTGTAVREGNNTVVLCYHVVEYGKFLEMGTSKMPALPSIIPAMMQVGPEIVKDAQTVVTRLLGGK